MSATDKTIIIKVAKAEIEPTSLPLIALIIGEIIVGITIIFASSTQKL